MDVAIRDDIIYKPHSYLESRKFFQNPGLEEA
jgi:hypothetical protein